MNISRFLVKLSKPVITTPPYLERIFTFLWSHNGHNILHINTHIAGDVDI